MKIRTGAESAGRTIELELDDSEGILQFGKTAWDEMSVGDRFRKLSQLADLLLVNYLRADDLIGEEMARHRIEEIRRR